MSSGQRRPREEKISRSLPAGLHHAAQLIFRGLHQRFPVAGHQGRQQPRRAGHAFHFLKRLPRLDLPLHGNGFDAGNERALQSGKVSRADPLTSGQGDDTHRRQGRRNWGGRDRGDGPQPRRLRQ
ncbi:MAG: hypothetical protein ACKOFX_06335, partial [Solirubrobacterales bacterium]